MSNESESQFDVDRPAIRSIIDRERMVTVVTYVFDEIEPRSSARTQHDCASGFVEGFLTPHIVYVKLMEQEPILEYVPSETENVLSAWRDAMLALNTAMVRYAEEN